MIQIYYTNIASISNTNLVDETILLLPEKIKNEISAYKYIEQKLQVLVGKLLLQLALKNCALNYTLADLQYHEKEKPFLSSEFDFNIAHSGSYVILAFVKAAKIGVDIEKHRPIDIHLFKKYFNTAEWNVILNEINSQNRFFYFWSIKESAIKCDGRGVEILSKTNVLNTSSLVCDENILFYTPIDIAQKYSACVCCSQPYSIEFVQNINALELLNSR